MKNSGIYRKQEKNEEKKFTRNKKYQKKSIDQNRSLKLKKLQIKFAKCLKTKKEISCFAL